MSSSFDRIYGTESRTVTTYTTDPAAAGRTTETFPWKQYKAVSRQLEEWRTLDFSGMGSIIRDHLGDDLKDIKHRNPAILRRQSKDESAQYVLPVTRSFTLNGEPLSPVQEKAIRQLYKKLRVDRVLRHAQERAVPQNHVLIALVPDRKQPSRGRLQTYLAYEVCDLEMSDPSEADLGHADRVVLDAPWPSAEKHRTEMRRLVLTQTAAWYELGDGKRQPVFSLDETSHKFTGCPVVGVRLEDPASKAFWWPSLSQDMRGLQISQSVCHTDAEDLTIEYAPGLQVLAGPQAAEMAREMQRGPRNMQIFPYAIDTDGEGVGVQFQYHKTEPSSAQLIAIGKAQLAVGASTRYSSPDGLTGDSADAKEVERDDQLMERTRQEDPWREVEEQVLRLIIEWHNQVSTLKLPIPDIEVGYNYVKPSRNSLQEAQAAAILGSLGAIDIRDLVQTNGRNLSPAQRAKLLDQNRQGYAAWRAFLGDHIPAGLDASATFMGLGPPKPETPKPDEEA